MAELSGIKENIDLDYLKKHIGDNYQNDGEMEVLINGYKESDLLQHGVHAANIEDKKILVVAEDQHGHAVRFGHHIKMANRKTGQIHHTQESDEINLAALYPKSFKMIYNGRVLVEW